MQVKQIANLFKLMEFFVRAKQPLSVREIVDEFGWPRSSVFNIVSTLVDQGYLYQPGARGGYYPTARWMDLARAFADSQPLPASVHQLLEVLMQKTGETMVLAAPDGTHALLLDVVESPAAVRYTADIGARIPIQVTSAGRAILSQYGPGERAALLQRVDYQAFQQSAFPGPEAVEADILRSSERGWFVNLEDFARGLAGVAVPFAFRGRRNALVLGAPVSRIDGRLDELGSLLKEAVATFIHSHEN